MNQALARRRTRWRKRWWLASLASLLLVGSEPTSGQQPRGGSVPVSLFDARLASLRNASARWAVRQGPERAVIDQVCLVPDLATFYAALAGWDRAHYFPILIEDAESTLRFLRAFHPARVIRHPRAVPPLAPGEAWTAATAALRASWREPGAEPDRPSRAEAVTPPEALGPTPPGVVISHANSPTLAGAVALAAGRFQSLVRFDSKPGYRWTLTLDEFHRFDHDLSRAIARVAPNHLGLGDDCDFVTMAGNYPYRYRDAKEEDNAVDDGLGRTESGTRWAYVGRIVGNPATSVYQAMCSLFLQPEATTLFSGYDEMSRPWADYSPRGAGIRLSGMMTTSLHQASEPAKGAARWHEAFDPENQSGLIWINSHGTPTVFNLRGDESASTSDVPRTVPCAVVMVHSFSAADPTNPDTIAGRWLANGAFVYFGAINEPFLQAFRTPQFAVDLLLEHLPLVAVLRNTSIEPFGDPWRLEYLGDPLFRIKPRAFGRRRDQAGAASRTGPDETTRDWPIVAGPNFVPTPASITQLASPEAILQAGFNAALALVGSPRITPSDPALTATIANLAEIDREALCPDSRRLQDSLLADLLFHANRRSELRARIESIPPVERSAELRRWLDALRGIDFNWVTTGDDFSRIIAAWTRIIGSDALDDFQQQTTARVGALANEPDRRAEWAEALRVAISKQAPCPTTTFLRGELKRIEAAFPVDRRAGNSR